MKVDLVSMEVLRPHEETIPKKVDELEKMTHRWRAYVLPLVVDKKTGDDITRNVLLQIIIEQEEDNGEPLFSAEVLQKLIGIYGNPNQSTAGDFLSKSVQLFCEQQKLFQNQVEEAFSANPMSSMVTEMTKRNMELWKEMQDSFLGSERSTSKKEDNSS